MIHSSHKPIHWPLTDSVPVYTHRHQNGRGEPGFDKLLYIFQIANLVPRGQFYLRTCNEMKFMVPGANVKYAAPWKEEWIVVEGDWGHTAFIGGVKYPVPTQFTGRDKWAIGVLSSESRDVL